MVISNEFIIFFFVAGVEGGGRVCMTSLLMRFIALLSNQFSLRFHAIRGKLLLFYCCICKSHKRQTIVFVNYSSIYWEIYRHHRPGNRLGCLSPDDVIKITTT